MFGKHLLILGLTILSIGFSTLFIYNFVEPKLFRYGCVKCNINSQWTNSCGVNCTKYSYELKYNDIFGYYDCENCKLQSDIYCEIIQPRYRNPYLKYITDKTFTTSNFLNAVLLFVFGTLSIVSLIIKVQECIRVSAEII